MDFDTFKRIVTAFADDPEYIDFAKGKLVVVVRDETISATLSQSDDGDLIVAENGDRLKARSWLVKRLARLPLLAERIVANVSAPACFVASSGRVERHDSVASGSSTTSREPDMAKAVSATLGRPPLPGTTSVWYLTADAGEGKTSLINHLAIEQAKAYLGKNTHWLLVPIPLGGGTFLRFDDVVVAALVNRLRFQLLYYEAFLELVRLGVVVPAFDGFEEMIIEGSSGEAIGALGHLVQNLHSAGTVLMAARTAYFEYLSFRAQARLFDAIGKDDVAFGRLSLNRWDRQSFVEYARQRQAKAPEDLYKTLAKGLPAGEHPLLTRAVLASRIVDIAIESEDSLCDLLGQVGQRPREDYFFEFVRTIVEREARIKWLDRSGDPPQPLLTTEEHHDLLSLVAKEMWLCSADALKTDEMDFVADLFVENTEKQPAAARQIRERLKQHALLVAAASGRALAFDHEDFRHFYLGEAIGRDLVNDDEQGVKALLEVAALPRAAVDQAAVHMRRRNRDFKAVLRLLQKLATPQPPTSFVRENCGALTLAMVDAAPHPWTSAHMSFPNGALLGRSLRRLTVTESHFLPSSLAGTRLEACKFANCRIDRLEEGQRQEIRRTVLDACDVGSVMYDEDGDTVEVYAPQQIKARLSRMGFTIEAADAAASAPCPEARAELSDDLKLVQRVLRVFLRSTAVNESTMDLKLGTQRHHFRKSVLPALIDAGILEKVPYFGHGTQRRFRLGVQMQRIQDALAASGGELGPFVDAARKSAT